MGVGVYPGDSANPFMIGSKGEMQNAANLTAALAAGQATTFAVHYMKKGGEDKYVFPLTGAKSLPSTGGSDKDRWENGYGYSFPCLPRDPTLSKDFFMLSDD